MRPFLLSPRWLAVHVLAIALVAGFVALGWWQLGAFRDGQARQELRDRPAVPVGELATPTQPLGQAIDRAVTVTGTYLPPLTVPARVHDGVLGAYAVAPLRTPDGVLLVLRGWLPTQDAVAEPPAGPVTASGHLVAAETPGQATGRTPLPAGQVGYLAPAPAAAVAGVDAAEFYDGYLLLATERPAPVAAPERLDLDVLAPIRNVGPWQNLSYWAQWWVFAAAVVVFWASLVRSALTKRRAPRAPVPDAAPAPSPRPSARR